jgi:hypothetical protein
MCHEIAIIFELYFIHEYHGNWVFALFYWHSKDAGSAGRLVSFPRMGEQDSIAYKAA